MPDADVVIVGFRCAGAPLALALHRAGVRTIVVDKAPFFTDQPISTHAIQPYGMAMLDRLGLGDLVRDLAPANSGFRFQVEQHYLHIDLEGSGMCSHSPRRSRLDSALQRAALDAGVDARERTRVTGLLLDGERVVGVRVQNSERQYEIRAPLVVGADGRSSSIARLVAAPAYLEDSVRNGGMYWSYFEKTKVFDEDPRYDWGACIHVEGRSTRAVFQTDSDLLLMAGGGRGNVIDGWGQDPGASLLEHLRRGSMTAPLLEGSRMVERPLGLVSLHLFMKRPVGPGWALVGDAGLHLDPTPGLGIADAFRDAVALSAAIIDGSERAMNLYWRRRDAESLGLYHFAANMGSESYNNPLTQVMFKRGQRSARVRKRMFEMMARKRSPLDTISPANMLGWLFAESLSGNFAPWPHLGHTLRFGLRVAREQAIVDRALARAERGVIDDALPFPAIAGRGTP